MLKFWHWSVFDSVWLSKCRHIIRMFCYQLVEKYEFQWRKISVSTRVECRWTKYPWSLENRHPKTLSFQSLWSGFMLCFMVKSILIAHGAISKTINMMKKRLRIARSYQNYLKIFLINSCAPDCTCSTFYFVRLSYYLPFATYNNILFLADITFHYSAGLFRARGDTLNIKLFRCDINNIAGQWKTINY